MLHDELMEGQPQELIRFGGWNIEINNIPTYKKVYQTF